MNKLIFNLKYKFFKKTAIAFPYYTLGYYDFPKTYLGSRKLEKIRRKFYYYYVINQISKLLKINKKEIYSLYLYCIRNCKDIINNIYKIHKAIPRKRYGGYPNPEIFYVLIRLIRPKIVIDRSKLWSYFSFYFASFT